MKDKLLIDLIIEQYENNSKWNNETAGNSSYRINVEDYDKLGSKDLVSQAKSLEEQGLLKIVWVKGFRNFDIDKVTYPLSNMNKFCEMAGREPRYITIVKQLKEAQEFYNKIKTPWIRKYLETEVIHSLERGRKDECPEKTILKYKCLEQLDVLDTPMFKRVFSNHYLNGSKVFENELQTFIIRIAKKYNDDIDEAMENSEVLNQLNIEEYAQELSIKGSLRIEIEHNQIDTKDFQYGLVLNTQTLKNVVIIDNPQVKKIVTIENKANFVAEPYEDGTIIVFSHGFFSPSEKTFLKNLYSKIKDQEVIYLHSSDLDYGGVRIFKYIKNNIFPDVKPYRMDITTFEKYKQYSEKITGSCLEKIKKCEEPLLQDVINTIIETGLVIEQEAYI